MWNSVSPCLARVSQSELLVRVCCPDVRIICSDRSRRRRRLRRRAVAPQHEFESKIEEEIVSSLSHVSFKRSVPSTVNVGLILAGATCTALRCRPTAPRATLT